MLKNTWDTSCSDMHVNHLQYADLYKTLTRNKETSQADRREQFLKEIRKYVHYFVKIFIFFAIFLYGFRRRNNAIDECRGPFEEFQLDAFTEDMEVEKVIQHKRKCRFKNKLTFTEWLVDIPVDLESNWYVKFCPYGQRCLIVAEKVITQLQTIKAGFLEADFSVNIPTPC